VNRSRAKLPCRVVDCTNPSMAKGLCQSHYGQAHHGKKLSLRGGDTVPERPRWIFEGDEQSLIAAQEKANEQQFEGD
jgi:hypothetical protein